MCIIQKSTTEYSKQLFHDYMKSFLYQLCAINYCKFGCWNTSFNSNEDVSNNKKYMQEYMYHSLSDVPPNHERWEFISLYFFWHPISVQLCLFDTLSKKNHLFSQLFLFLMHLVIKLVISPALVLALFRIIENVEQILWPL